MANYRLLIFDFDGTLADSFSWFLGALDELAPRHRFRPVHPKRIDYLRGLDARGVMRELNVAWWRLPLIARDCRKMAAQHSANLTLFTGATELLCDLKSAGLQLAVVSTNAETNVRAVLGAHADLIDNYDCGGGLFRKRLAIKRVLRRSRAPAAQALYIGDEIRDYHAATSAGVDFGAACWGFTKAQALQALNARYCFAEIGEIAEQLIAPHKP